MRLKRGDTEILEATAYLGNTAYTALADATEVAFIAKSLLSLADGSAEISKTLTGGGVTVSGNVATVTINATDWTAVPYRTTELKWEIQIVAADSAVYTIASGVARVDPDIVRATS